MATHSDTAELRDATPSASGRLVEYEAFIESQLRKTRSHVRGVDLAAHVLTFLAGMLGYLLLAGVVDHWVVPGGLGFWGRLLFLAGGLTLAGYLAARTLPLLVKRINPLYAAQTIERSRPALKNGLLNFLFFRENPAGLNPVVYQAIEEQAATNLAHAHEDVAVDRTQLIRVGYVLVGILLLCAVYTLFSPKDLFRTAGRVIMPWAELEPPTRTLISGIEPGNVQAFRGDRLTIKAHIENLEEGERVTLYYSTADAQTVNRAVEMRLPPDGYKFECVIPSAEASLQQSLIYRIEAGDAISPEHRLDVTDAPTILVRSVEYKYPAYTGLRSQRVENQGDLKAIEGSEITLHAQANEAIESAHVDFNCDDQLDRRMTSEENLAHATFFLSLQADRQTPTHKAYRLVFKNAQGQRNPQPVRYEIEVTRDLSPEIQFVSPKPADIELPLDGSIELEVVANDPDFALRSIKLVATAAGQPLVDKLLLDEVWRGQAVKKFRFAPRKLGLKAGDVVDYLAIAQDNRDPQPNRTETAARRIRIVSPAGKLGDERLAKRDRNADRSADEPGASEPGGGKNEHPRDADQPAGDAKPDENGVPDDNRNSASEPAGEEGATEPQAGANGEQTGEAQAGSSRSGAEQAAEEGDAKGASGEGKEGQNGEAAAPSDGSNDGEAFDRILKKLNESDPKQPSTDDGAPSDTSEAAAGKPSPDANGQKGSQQQPGQEPGKQPPDGQPEAAKQPDPKQGSGEKGDQQNDSGEKGNDQQGGGEKGAGDKQSGEQGPGDQAGEPGNAGPKVKGAGKQGSKPGPAGQDNLQGADEAAAPDAQAGANGKEKPAKDSAGADAAESSDDPGDKGAAGKQGKGQDPKNPAEGNTHPSGDADSEGEPGEKRGQNGATSGDKPQDKGQHSPETSETGGQEPADQSGADPSSAGDKPRGGGDDARKSLTPDDKPANDAEGQGAKSQDDALAKPDKQAPRDKQGSNSQGGDAEKNKGNSGAGQRGQQSKGSPSPDQPNQPREKRPAQSKEDQEEKPNDEAQSPSNSQRESDSEGQDSGDRSGGGKQGGGQKANKSGTGGAGQNTAADEGAGKSQEAGQGEDSDRAGTGGEADKPTGQQGDKQGAGSKTRPAGSAGEGQPGEKSSPDGQPGSPSNQPNAEQPGTPGGAQSGQSPAEGTSNPQQSEQAWKAGQDQAEKANLDYARKATDLALRHLKEELAKDQPDQQLLKELGWSRDETQHFIDRWEQMRAKSGISGQSGKAAQRELDDALRSLGLRARATTLRGNQARGNKVHGYKESRRATPPPEFAEEYKAYTEGTARGGK